MDLGFLKNTEYLFTVIAGITVLFIIIKISKQKY